MHRAKIESQLLLLVEHETGHSCPALDKHDDLKDGLGIDSVDLLDLAMRIEQQFAITLENQELWRLHTVGDLLDLLQVKLAAVPARASEEPS
jgi:acyl carrier protein